MRPEAVPAAWDEAEKSLVDLGLGWDIVRCGDQFWLDLGWARVAVVVHEDRPFYRVSQKNLNSGGRLLQWDCRNVEALVSLIDLLWTR